MQFLKGGILPAGILDAALRVYFEKQKTIEEFEMVAQPELLLHLSTGEKAASKEVLEFVKENGVEALKVSRLCTIVIFFCGSVTSANGGKVSTQVVFQKQHFCAYKDASLRHAELNGGQCLVCQTSRIWTVAVMPHPAAPPFTSRAGCTWP